MGAKAQQLHQRHPRRFVFNQPTPFNLSCYFLGRFKLVMCLFIDSFVGFSILLFLFSHFYQPLNSTFLKLLPALRFVRQIPAFCHHLNLNPVHSVLHRDFLHPEQGFSTFRHLPKSRHHFKCHLTNFHLHFHLITSTLLFMPLFEFLFTNSIYFASISLFGLYFCFWFMSRSCCSYLFGLISCFCYLVVATLA